MTNLKFWCVVFILAFSCSVGRAVEVDFSKPDSVAMEFLEAAKAGEFERVPPLVMEKHQKDFHPDKLKAALAAITLPDEIELKVEYSKNGTRAAVAVVGTGIGLELRLIDGRWLLEH